MTSLTRLFTFAQQSWLHRLWFNRQSEWDLGRDSDNLYMFIMWTCMISFFVVIGLMLVFVVKYRRRPAAAAATGYQVSASHNTPLELAWSIIPLLVMVVIFFWGFEGYVRKLVAPAGAEEIRVTGQQWNWSATYSNGKGADELKRIGNKDSVVIPVPAGRPVKFIMHSTDVIHSWYVPLLRIKMDVFPNRYTSMWFQPATVGRELEVYCAEYCGKDHSEMAAWIRVIPADEFDRWKKTELPPENTPEAGKKLYTLKGCASCHSVDGKASTGPTWKDLFGHAVEFTDGTSHTAEEMADSTFFANYIRESVLTPKAKIVKGYPDQMNSYQGLISEPQLDAIITYMKSLSDKAPKDGATAPAAPASDAGAAPAQSPQATPPAPQH